jgi:hypothetical protein
MLRSKAGSTTDFQVPLYQRRYDWSEKQVEILCDDLLEALEKGKSHFFGAITLISSHETESLAGEYEVIDGQQRLTTLSLLFFALSESEGFVNPLAGRGFREFCFNAETGLPRLNFENPWDGMAYRQILMGHHCAVSQKDNQILKNFKVIKEQIEMKFSGKNDYLGDQKRWARLQLAKVVLPPDLIPERIFRRMNGSRLELGFKDLVRNFLLMEASGLDEKEVYRLCEEIPERYLKLVAIAETRGRVEGIRSLYSAFRVAFEKIARNQASEVTGKLNTSLQFLSQMENEWIPRLTRLEKFFTSSFDHCFFHNGDRYGSHLMRATVILSENEAKVQVARLIRVLRRWMVTYRINNGAVQYYYVDGYSGWGIKGGTENWMPAVVTEELESILDETSDELLREKLLEWLNKPKEHRGKRIPKVLGFDDSWELEDILAHVNQKPIFHEEQSPA